jgi:hypothetical protein
MPESIAVLGSLMVVNWSRLGTVGKTNFSGRTERSARVSLLRGQRRSFDEPADLMDGGLPPALHGGKGMVEVRQP